jgi:serine phosphatase RsbU (regulator of sigma subunit)
MTVIADIAVDSRTHDNLWLQALGVRAFAAVPFEDRDGTVLGAFCVADVTRRVWSKDDLEMLSAVAETAASKVALRGEVRVADELAEVLQHSMLTELPDVRHVQLAARYLPARVTAQIGGDWYDAFVLPDGITALVVGDVAGHDLPAAAKMGQLRNLLRGIACHTNPAPHEVLAGLDKVVFSLGVADLATAVYGRVEPRPDGAWAMRWANAGHPPPLLVTADGAARYLQEPSGVLLALGDAQHTDGVVDLPPLSTLLLYTDGLVESRDLDIDRGFDRLRRTAVSAAQLPVGQFCDEVVGRLADGANEDDVTVLALRIPLVDGRGRQSWTPDGQATRESGPASS